MAVLTQKIRK